MMEKILEVRNLDVRFKTDSGIVHAVGGMGYHLNKGEALGIVGESGCGKSVSCLSLLRLIPTPPGIIAPESQILLRGDDILKYTEKEMTDIRGCKIGMIFQDPMTSLNPFLRIETQLTETIRLHLEKDRKKAHLHAVEMLEKVGIPNAARRIRDYPHQFSGGMRQRVMIAMALSCNPDILVADEPTTALDVTIQAQILDLIGKLQKDFGSSVILITHDLGVVAGICSRVIVMYAGSIMEEASTEKLFGRPRHPYTKALLASVPRLDEESKVALDSIQGSPPDLTALPPGCPFYERCTYRKDKCREHFPDFQQIDEEHKSACWQASEL